MENLDLYLKDLIGKDESKAEKAAVYLINNSDVKLFNMLVEKSDVLFDFVRGNVEKRIEKAVSKDNFMNIINFFDIYSIYYDNLFANILAKHANQDLTDEMFDMLEKGSIAQKTYSAKYFSLIPDTVALEPLSKYAFDDDENLSYNAAEALGQMQDDISFDIALSFLESKDDFEKLKAVKFFTAYGRNYPFKDIYKAMLSSKMPENIAGQIPYMESLMTLINSEDKQDVLAVIDNILSGLGEILPIADIFQFELYEVLNYLISLNYKDNEYSSRIAEILLSALSKFTMFCENQEYIFDEDKNTKYEVSSILKLLQGQGKEFWKNQEQYLYKELKKSDDRIIPALHIISEYKLVNAISEIKDLLNSKNEIVICEAINTLKILNAVDDIDISVISEKIQNSNIKAIIENI